MSFEGNFRAFLTKEHDGDSFWVMADTLFGGRHEPELRLLGVHAPELDEDGGPETTACVNEWLKWAALSQPKRRWPLWVRTIMTKVYEPDQKQTFTRYLATVWRMDDIENGGGRSINDHVNEFLASHPEWGPGE